MASSSSAEEDFEESSHQRGVCRDAPSQVEEDRSLSSTTSVQPQQITTLIEDYFKKLNSDATIFLTRLDNECNPVESNAPGKRSLMVGNLDPYSPLVKAVLNFCAGSEGYSLKYVEKMACLFGKIITRHMEIIRMEKHI